MRVVFFSRTQAVLRGHILHLRLCISNVYSLGCNTVLFYLDLCFSHPASGTNWWTLFKITTYGLLSKKTWSSVNLAAHTFSLLTLCHHLIIVLIFYHLSLFE